MVPCITEVLGESGFGSIYDPESSTFVHLSSHYLVFIQLRLDYFLLIKLSLGRIKFTSKGEWRYEVIIM